MFPNKIKPFLLFFLLPLTLLGQSPSDEAALFTELVEISKKNLVEEQALLKFLLEYQKKREAFLVDPTSVSSAKSLVHAAKNLQKQVQNSQFQHLFSSDLLTELAFFSEGWKKQ